jgi:AraC-like DNA-binding protein
MNEPTTKRINVQRGMQPELQGGTVNVPLVEGEPYFQSDALSAFSILMEAHKVDTLKFAFDNLQEDLLLLNIGQPVTFNYECQDEWKDLSLASGDALLVLSKSGPYNFSTKGTGDLFVIQLPHDQTLETELTSVGANGEYLKQFRNHGLYHLVLALFEIAKNSNSEESDSLVKIMQAIVSHLHVQITTPDNESTSLLKPHDVSLVADYIVANPTQKISSKTLANVVGFSPAHMVRLFKRHYGLTPFRYWLNQRIERAKWLLERTDMPLSAIAKELVFEDQSHFTKVFCRSIGMTPNRYRRNFKSSYASGNNATRALSVEAGDGTYGATNSQNVYALTNQHHVQAVVTESGNQTIDRLPQLQPSTSGQA